VCLFVPILTKIGICLKIRVKNTGTNIHANPSVGSQLLRSARYDEASKVVAFRNFFANESKSDSSCLQYFTD